ncbi:ciliary-associated calcium-binding coiled-coil protein 1 [Periophthalmus magnuspinnatus]|uniref:ciliary-associated calcium-binding coiled-coil protein 1 n=1 Tax=Periophthalmus magnuspinnatus TaxID=409849 RepID=UPI00243726F7|nr:ciliary-associated calcium-binding coiled-coil protein 1 [Periophthalmus magnuspinnatus]
MSLEQLEVALGQSEEELHLLLSDKLDLANSHVCMREAALLQYYLQGMCWAQDAHLSPLQTSFTMAVLDTLLHNVTEKGMDFVDNVLEFAKALAVACHCPPGAEGPSSFLSPEEVQSLIRFIRDSLFQKYQLFKALSSGQEELLLSIEETVDVLCIQDALTALEDGTATHLVTPESDINQ